MKQSDTVLQAACQNRQNETRHIVTLAKERRQGRENGKNFLEIPSKDALKRAIMSPPNDNDEMMRDLSLEDWINFLKTKTTWYKNDMALIQQLRIPTLKKIIGNYPHKFGGIKFDDTPLPDSDEAVVVPEESISTPRRRGGKASDDEKRAD